MFLRTPELTLHAHVAGPADAPALLLLHSLGTDLRVWDEQAVALTGSFRVIRPDLRGHGLSGIVPGPGAMANFARDALSVLDALGVARVHVGGLSIGGLVAQALAALAPERVASLMLCDTALAIPPPAFWRDRAGIVRAQGMAAIADAVLARWVTPGFLDDPSTAGLRAMLLRTPPEGYAAAAEAIAAADFTTQTAALRLPALVLVGDQDLATPPAAARALVAAIPGAALHIIEGAAHIPNFEQAAAMTAALRGFLEART